jgi:4-aminobutyrate aminotransferase-like enzyme
MDDRRTSTVSHGIDALETTQDRVAADLERLGALHRRYREGRIHVHVPPALVSADEPLDDLVHEYLPASKAALEAASKSLFYSLPVAFDPAHSIGPFLATVDRDAEGQPYRFLDMGALIATQAFGENDPAVVEAVLNHLPYAFSRYAHSEYQTAVSLQLKAELSGIAPAGTPRHFVVNTGAEAVENAIKSVLLNRVKTTGDPNGGFIISFEGAFHGRTLGSLAVTHRKKARLGFPTFDWPQVSFPVVDDKPKETARREEKSLKQIWDLLVSGRLPHAEKSKETFQRELDAIDTFLAAPRPDANAFVLAQRAALSADTIRRSRRVAAVLVEPIQGEGGVRLTSPGFMRRLRLLTGIYDVPLVFDEIQTGWGATGRMWAHELFELPLPPDIVIWAKKAQNGVLFVSEEMATFFQEEKKFNTTWEGEPVGMVRLLAMLHRIDLEQVRRTGERARGGLEKLARDYTGLIQNVRGAGVMLAFDVARADWRDALRDRAFRRGLVLLPAGERALRFYPRYDTEPYAIDEALSILRTAVEDIVSGRVEPSTTGPNIRVGALECLLEAIDLIDITAANFPEYKAQVMEVEVEHYGALKQYPPDVLHAGRRPLLQFPAEVLETTLSNDRAIGVALRDGVRGRIVAYALGSALENHDEEGVGSDPAFGEHNTFYLQAMATLPSVQNQAAIENKLLEFVRLRAVAAGFEYMSTLIEERIHQTGPDWLRQAQVIQVIDNYLRSGICFVYLHVPLERQQGPDSRVDIEPPQRRVS